METQPKCWNSSLYDVYRKRYTDLSVDLETRTRVSTEDVLELLVLGNCVLLSLVALLRADQVIQQSELDDMMVALSPDRKIGVNL